MSGHMTNLRNEIKFYISGQRYDHTIYVYEECVKLAALFGLSQEDADKLRVAALLHDITKEKNTSEQIELMEKFNVPYDGEALLSPKTLHTLTGAELAKNDFARLVDENIYNAIKYHATGRENMTLIEKLLHLADYIEKSRKYKNCAKLRKYFYSELKNSSDPYGTLNDALIISFDMTLENLLKHNEYIDIQTIRSRNYLIMEKTKQGYKSEKRKIKKT